METKIKVENLKCGGCATTVENGLLEIEGVEKVIVLPEIEEVDITHSQNASMETIKEKLKHMGYPEAGTVEGLEKLGANVKSYVSCAIGRIDKLKTDKSQ